MNILQSAWRYWKWLCVAFVTTAIVLLALATAVNYFKSPSADKELIGACIDHGGTWDDAESVCKNAA